MTEDEITAAFRRLRALDAELVAEGANKHDRVDILIHACIVEGFDTGPRILGALDCLSFDKQHIGILLRAGIRNDPQWPNWGRRDDGTYYVP